MVGYDFNSMFAILSAQDVELPLRLSEEDLGVVLDAKGRDIFTVDVNGERDDVQVRLIAQQLVLAINSHVEDPARRRVRKVAR